MRLSELNVEAFTELLASDAPAPGGGSAAALEGSIGAALVAMVCELTANKSQYAEHRDHVLETQKKAEHIRTRLADVMERDTRAFMRVSAAFAMPKNTEEEKAARSAAIQQGLAGCIETPLEMMELASQALELAASLSGRSNKNAASDLGVAVLSLHACIRGAWLNMLININSLKDRDLAESYRRRGEAIQERILPLADRIYNDILHSLQN